MRTKDGFCDFSLTWDADVFVILQAKPRAADFTSKAERREIV
jgi:hypothetical protein